MSCICDVCVRVAASVRKGALGESTLSFVLNQHRWCMEWARRGVGGTRQRRRRSGGGDGRTPTVADARTCDADRYGMRVSCHMCAGSGKPSREWQWAETVNRTKGGGYARAFRQDAFVSTRPGRRGTRATGTGYGEISDPYRLRSDPREFPGVFMCARGCAGK